MKPWLPPRLVSVAALLAGLTACSSDRVSGSDPNTGVIPRTDTSGQCQGICDASSPSIPILTDSVSYGDITTYGSVSDPAPSQGGACNYGSTQVYAFAAIQVNQLPGDLKGQWQGGHICGQCLEVSLRSSTGWKTTVLRIMDKCPDGNCGVDLGGEPAQVLMGDLPGRYSGKWQFVSCDGYPEVSDGPPTLFVKDGSNPYWSLVQVRNPAAQIAAIRIRPSAAGGSAAWDSLPWATEAENFYHVPVAVLQDSGDYDLQVDLPSGPRYGVTLKGSDLAEAQSSWPLQNL